MSTSPSTRNAAPCGCGTAGKPLATTFDCGCGAGTLCSTGGFVRPRFFAGQLLTEDDLQALSDYVVAKNRLHNRHFLGDGVVCGLQVYCDPCGGAQIVVQPGHALDCCGNDLVLDCAVQLDAIAMVNELRVRQRGGADCGDPCADRLPNGKPRDPTSKDTIERHYCLYLRYNEMSSDPVAPYATDEPCGATACEPTRIREDVRFELRCHEGMPPRDGFLHRALACLKDLAKAEALSKAFQALFEGGAATPEELAAARLALLERLDAGNGMTDCRLRADVAAITIPPAGGDTDTTRRQLVLAYLRVVRDCVCRALLPLCPPCNDAGVLLACLTMADCLVTSICNLERKFVLTGPNLRYWFPLDLIGDLFERLCCSPIKLRATPPAPHEPTPSDPLGRMASVSAAMAAGSGKDDKDNNDNQDDDIEEVRDRLLNAMAEHVRVAFGLSERNVMQLAHIAENFGDIVEAGGFDDVLPIKALRGLAGFGVVTEGLSDQVVASSAFARATAKYDRQQAKQAKALEAVTAHNSDLQARLDLLLTRVGKLEAPPNPDGDESKKTRK